MILRNLRTLVNERTGVMDQLLYKIDLNSTNINHLLEENRRLQRENTDLQDRLTRIETTQLNNNIVINGMPEQSWEPYEVTKEQITEVIASSMGLTDEKSGDCLF